MLSSLGNWFDGIGSKIAALPGLIVDGIIDGLKYLLIPDEEYIQSKIDYLQEQFESLGISSYDMSSFLGQESELENITCELYGQEVVIVNMEYMILAIEKFRPVIRAFIILLLVLYNYNQFMHLIGSDGITLGGNKSTMSEEKSNDISANH